MKTFKEDIQKIKDNCLNKIYARNAVIRELDCLAYRKKHGEKVHEPFTDSPLSMLVRIVIECNIFSQEEILDLIKERRLNDIRRRFPKV